MLIEKTMFGEINKEEVAIERIKYYQNRNKGNKNIQGMSFGKDSIVLFHLMKRSGIDFEAIYSNPSVDPPELKEFRDKYYKGLVTIQPFEKDEDGKEITMWTLIEKKLLPPTRLMRYCCSSMKERTGSTGDTVYVGVRAAESSKRSKHKLFSFFKGKNMVRPLLDWTDEDIWEYINKYNLPVPSLYTEKGFKRIGCIGCPLSSNQNKELEMYPKIRDNYIRAFDRMVIKRKKLGKDCDWNNGLDVYNWWTRQSISNEVEGQCSMFF